MRNRWLAMTLGAGLIGALVSIAPVSTVATLADGPVSTAASDPVGPISADSGAPLGDEGTGTDPLIPYGTDPQSPVRLGYVDRNHDEGVTTNGEIDTPF
ncbi:hypothetical protein [Mycolicibacterium grossiae]|uniref:hypothetical protein n=1 Tax=Mycolicibacterium grossiae TaxID=1552759 RepID=UPI000F796513|nr:hypothetical protein [Mycolicibacterium grossiae]QEM44099.1 hypothetical protein FZ046_04255 [Mycolicibacterium grossiae]